MFAQTKNECLTIYHRNFNSSSQRTHKVSGRIFKLWFCFFVCVLDWTPVLFLPKYFELLVFFFFVVYSGKDVLKKIKEDTGGEFRTTLMNLIEVRPYWLLSQNSDWHLCDWTSLCQVTDVTTCRVLASACGSLWLGNEERKLSECLNEDLPKTTPAFHCMLHMKLITMSYFTEKTR